MALNSMVVGEPLLDAKLSLQPGQGGLLPMLVPDGLRGVTIKVDDAVRESGFVHPNSRVDVVVSVKRKKSSGGRIAKVVLQNIPVLAAGQAVEMKGNKPVSVTTVTLALTPEQAERLSLAKTEGRLMLATRNLSDDQIVQTSGVNVNRLLHNNSAAPSRRKSTSSRVARKSRPPSHTVSVYHGNRVTEHHFVEQGNQQWAETGQ